MKTPRIANAMSHIDDDLISGASDERIMKTKNNSWLKWASMAACVAVMLGAVATFVPMMFKENGGIPIGSDGDSVTGDKPGPGTVGENVIEKYYDYSIKSGAFSIYTHGKVVAAEKIGKKIEEVMVAAGWKNGNGEWISNENLKAEVYEIEGVKQDVSVALKFIDQGEAVTTTHYYEIRHPNADYNGMVLHRLEKQ